MFLWIIERRTPSLFRFLSIALRMGSWFGFQRAAVTSARHIGPRIVGEERSPIAALSSSSSSSEEDLEAALAPIIVEEIHYFNAPVGRPMGPIEAQQCSIS